MPDAFTESNHDAPAPAHPAPLPPPPPAAHAVQSPQPTPPPTSLGFAAPPRPGQLTVGWQIMLAAAWSAAFFAYAAVWKTSEEIGIGTWWLGPRADPQPALVRIFPFAVALAMGLLTVYNVRRIALLSVVVSLLLSAIAVFDMSRSGGLAAIEYAISASMLLVSIGAAVGSIRRR